MEWGKGIPIPTTWRIWDLDVDEPIVLFPVRELIGALFFVDCLVDQDGYRECNEGSSKVLPCAADGPLESGILYFGICSKDK